MPICLSKQSKTVKQSKFATNSPVFFISNIKAQESLKIYFWGKIHFVLGLLARDIASNSFICSEHTFNPGLKSLETALTGDVQNPSEAALVNGVEAALLAGVEVPGLALEQRRTGTQSPPSPRECSLGPC